MTVRFVSPIIDMNYARKGLKEATQLKIARECEDGQHWFAVPTVGSAIKNYCEEYGYDVSDIEWLVLVHPDDWRFSHIIAKDIDEWEKQFNALNAEFKRI